MDDLFGTDEEAREIGRKLAADELTMWLNSQHQREMDMLLPKAEAYGSYDLELIGVVMGDFCNVGGNAQELGIAFYALGKLARVLSALKDGNKPSADTWTDLSIYGRMGLKVNETGRWL